LITVSYFEAASGQDAPENLNWNWELRSSHFAEHRRKIFRHAPGCRPTVSKMVSMCGVCTCVRAWC